MPPGAGRMTELEDETAAMAEALAISPGDLVVGGEVTAVDGC